jgi:Protein of unknown function (DUF1549)/Protein of unknown function (DUF1553)
MHSHGRPRLEQVGAIALLAVVGVLGCSRSDREPRLSAPTARSESSSAAQPTALDRAIAAHWEAAGVVPVAPADEATLLRRASLDLLGRIPTLAEQDAFAEDREPERWERTVDRMLASDEHADYLGDRYTELLLDGALQVPPKVREGTQAWLASRFAVDAPLDAIARETLTASGELAAEGPGGFMLAHGRKGRNAALAGATARVWLGAQIQCAQCHDHPSEAFTQRDFHAFAAHWARTKVQPRRGDDGIALRIVDRRRGEGRMPLAADAPDEPTGAILAPAYFGELTDGADRRAALADRIVGDRRFALALANRSWAQLFGRGIVEPVDAIPFDAKVPPLLDALADTLVADELELDPLLRTLVLSPAYRLASRAEGPGDARVAAFAQAAVRPLPPESLLRSLGTAAARDDDDASALAPALQRRRGMLREFRFTFDDDEATSDDDAGDLPRTLLWENGELTAMVASAKPGGPLFRLLRDEPDRARRIELLWRRFYARSPSADELAIAGAHLEAHADAASAYEDLMHSMLASSEFTTNH